MVTASGIHAGDPGSIPGCIIYILMKFLKLIIQKSKFHGSFQHLFKNINSIRQRIKKNGNKNCLNELNEVKFCEVSLNSLSNRCYKF